MRKFFRTFLLTGMAAVLVCGCKYDVKLTEEEATTTAEVVTEAPTTEAVQVNSSNTEKMKMILGNGAPKEGSMLEGFDIDGVMLAVPKEGSQNAGTGSIEVEKDGLRFELVMNPDERAGVVDYPVYSALKDMAKEAYGDFFEVEAGQIEDVSVESARTTFSYVNDSREGIWVEDATWYLIDLNDSQSLYVCAEICYPDVTENTEKIIEELEEYYDIEIQFDEEMAEEKLYSYGDESSDPNLKTVTYNNLSFDIPKDWAEDKMMSQDGMIAYAPGGSVQNSLCGVLIYQQSGGFYSDKAQFIGNEAEVRRVFEESMGVSISNLKVSDAGETFIGGTVKVSFDVAYSNGTEKYVAYYGLNTSRVYTVAAYGIGSHTNAAIEVVEMIMENGRK